MEIELGEIQEQFADIIWDREPIASGELVKIANSELGWKKSTTYTVLRKLCEKGLFQNVDGVVTSLMSKEDFAASKTHSFVDNHFSGSLPSFIAAFASKKKLSKNEVDAIQQMIDNYRDEAE